MFCMKALNLIIEKIHFICLGCIIASSATMASTMETITLPMISNMKIDYPSDNQVEVTIIVTNKNFIVSSTSLDQKCAPAINTGVKEKYHGGCAIGSGSLWSQDSNGNISNRGPMYNFPLYRNIESPAITVREAVKKIEGMNLTGAISIGVQNMPTYSNKAFYCLSYFVGDTLADVIHYTNFNGKVGGDLSGSCLIPPPKENSCSFKTQNINIDYGTLKTSTTAGASSSKDFQLECNGDVDFRFAPLYGNDSVALSNGMTAKLSVNSSKLNGHFKATKGDNDYKITSILDGTPVQGPFSGSSVLMISFY